MPEKLEKLNSNSPFGAAEWVTFGEETEAVIAQKSFYIDEISNTLLTVTGLGFCEIYVNGKNAAE